MVEVRKRAECLSKAHAYEVAKRGCKWRQCGPRARAHCQSSSARVVEEAVYIQNILPFATIQD